MLVTYDQNEKNLLRVQAETDAEKGWYGQEEVTYKKLKGPNGGLYWEKEERGLETEVKNKHNQDVLERLLNRRPKDDSGSYDRNGKAKIQNVGDEYFQPENTHVGNGVETLANAREIAAIDPIANEQNLRSVRKRSREIYRADAVSEVLTGKKEEHFKAVIEEWEGKGAGAKDVQKSINEKIKAAEAEQALRQDEFKDQERQAHKKYSVLRLSSLLIIPAIYNATMGAITTHRIKVKRDDSFKQHNRLVNNIPAEETKKANPLLPDFMNPKFQHKKRGMVFRMLGLKGVENAMDRWFGGTPNQRFANELIKLTRGVKYEGTFTAMGRRHDFFSMINGDPKDEEGNLTATKSVIDFGKLGPAAQMKLFSEMKKGIEEFRKREHGAAFKTKDPEYRAAMREIWVNALSHIVSENGGNFTAAKVTTMPDGSPFLGVDGNPITTPIALKDVEGNAMKKPVYGGQDVNSANYATLGFKVELAQDVLKSKKVDGQQDVIDQLLKDVTASYVKRKDTEIAGSLKYESAKAGLEEIRINRSVDEMQGKRQKLTRSDNQEQVDAMHDYVATNAGVHKNVRIVKIPDDEARLLQINGFQNETINAQMERQAYSDSVNVASSILSKKDSEAQNGIARLAATDVGLHVMRDVLGKLLPAGDINKVSISGQSLDHIQSPIVGVTPSQVRVR